MKNRDDDCFHFFIARDLTFHYARKILYILVCCIKVVISIRITVKLHIRYSKENRMIEIRLTETAKTELLKVLKNGSAKAIRLIQQGFG